MMDKKIFPKRNLFLFLILAIAIGIVTLWATAQLSKTKFPISVERFTPEEKLTPSDRARIISISGGKGFPNFVKEVIVDPFKARKGEKQTFSIWVKDPKGVKEVTALVKTDKSEEIIKMRLIEGTETEGKWIGFWITKDISAQSVYSMTFQAINREGQDVKMPLFWRAEK